MENVFRETTKDEQIKRQKQEQEFTEYLDKLIAVGKMITSDERYHEFRKIYEQLEAQGIELIINYENSDIQKFYTYITRLQERIKSVRMLIKEALVMSENPEEYKKQAKQNFGWFKNMFKF